MSSPRKQSPWPRGHSFTPIPTSENKEGGMNEEYTEEFSSLLADSPRSWRQRSKFSCTSSVFIVLLAITLSALTSTAMTLILGRSTAVHSLIPTSPHTESEHVPGQADVVAPFRPTPRLRHCGTSAAEARVLGCKFQIWSYSWVPPECYDAELVEEWLALRDWEYYDNRYQYGKVVNFTTEVLVGEGDRKLYSTWGQHYWHCAFSWRKFLRAALGSGVGITDRDLDIHHANHCQDTIRNKPDYRPWDENDIELEVGFHRC